MLTHRGIIAAHCVSAKNSLSRFPFTFIYELKQVEEIHASSKRVGYLSKAYQRMLSGFIESADTMQAMETRNIIESENKMFVNLLRS